MRHSESEAQLSHLLISGRMISSRETTRNLVMRIYYSWKSMEMNNLLVTIMVDTFGEGTLAAHNRHGQFEKKRCIGITPVGMVRAGEIPPLPDSAINIRPFPRPFSVQRVYLFLSLPLFLRHSHLSVLAPLGLFHLYLA